MDQIEMEKEQSYDWKLLFVVVIVVICLSVSIFSRNIWNKKTSMNIDEISLEVELFPSNHKKQYIIENRKLRAQLIDKSSGKIDSLIDESIVDSMKLEGILYLIDSFERDNYIDTCIQDGQFLRLTFRAKDQQVKTIVFQNKYNIHLHKIVEFINSNLSKSAAIFYEENDPSYSSSTCL